MAELTWGGLGRTIMAGINPSQLILQVSEWWSYDGVDCGPFIREGINPSQLILQVSEWWSYDGVDWAQLSWRGSIPASSYYRLVNGGAMMEWTGPNYRGGD